MFTILPFIWIVKHPSSWSLASENIPAIVSYISSVIGFSGIMSLLWMYILGTRTVAGLYFRDLVWTLKVHRWLGTYGIVAVFLHPFLMAYVYAENVFTYWLTPRLGTQFEQHITYGRLAFVLLVTIWVTSAIIRSKIKYRPWKYIHYLTYIILPLSLLHIHETGVSMQLPLVQFYFYVTIFVFIVITVLRARYFLGFGKTMFDIAEHLQIAKNIYMLTLHQPSKRLSIRPGQYVYVQRHLLSEEHPFSVADYDPDTGNIRLVYKVFGSFTEKLSKLQKGEVILVDGPYGTFTEQLVMDQNKPTIFIAGGIGITPFIKHIERRSSFNNTWLFYSVPDSNSSIYNDVFVRLLADKYVRILSKETQPQQENDCLGHLNVNLISDNVKNLGEYLFFLCGPKNMIEDIKSQLIESGVEKVQIHAEEFNF